MRRKGFQRKQFGDYGGMKSSLRFVLFVVVSSVLCLPLWAQVPGFPGDGLADRIAFWEKVFTIYGEDDLIVHDRERVDLIYDVITERNRDRGVRRVQQLLDEIRSRISTPEALSADAREIYDRIKADGVRMTAGDIAVLRSRIHVQRGINERFRAGIIRSGRYLAYFEQVFEEEGRPKSPDPCCLSLSHPSKTRRARAPVPLESGSSPAARVANSCASLQVGTTG